jgi:hypothetical protein
MSITALENLGVQRRPFAFNETRVSWHGPQTKRLQREKKTAQQVNEQRNKSKILYD